MRKPTVVAIDTDLGVLNRFERRLEELRLHNDFEYRKIEVGQPTLSEAAKHCCDMIRELVTGGEEIAAVFVDVAIFERSEPPFDQSGLEIAEALSKEFPSIPIIGMTIHHNDHRLVSEISFSPHIQGILIKNFFFEDEGFVGQNFLSFVARAKRKLAGTGGQQGDPSNLPPRELQSAPTRTGHRFQIANDPQSFYQASEIGEQALHSLLEDLFPHGSGTARSLRPGFSGSYVFKALVATAPPGISAGATRASVVKISRGNVKLEAELENFRRLRTRVKGNLYPALSNDRLVSHHGWAALAFDMEEDATTLLEYLQRNPQAKTALDLIQKWLIPFLKAHYGRLEQSKGPVFLWRTHFELKPRVKAGVNDFLNVAGDRVLRHLGRASKRTMEQIKDFVTDGRTFVHDVDAVVETGYIHGDLNSRNIMVPASEAKLVFIDFANSNQDHFMKDLAKLEIDLLLLGMDSKRWNDTEWEKITEWQRLLQLYERGKVLSPLSPKGRLASSVGLVVKLICALRSGVTTISGPRADERQYLIALLHYALCYLSYPDIQLPKKVFDVSLIGKLYESIHTAADSEKV